jgi:hypothetical protein
MIVLLVALVAVPIVAWLYARRFAPQFSATITAAALGLVISPVSMGLYATYFLGPSVLGPFGIVTGMIGLAAGMFHGAPGFHVARFLNLIPPGVVEGSSVFYVEAVNAVIWAAVYGAAGYLIDRIRRSRVAL